jgi:LemA protein
MNSLKWLIPVGLIGIFIFSMYGWVVGFNNRAVTLKEDSKTSWGNVESSYQRMNLIGNLVNTVSGAANLRSLH